MTLLGYALSGEEHAAPDLVTYAARAEAAGFEFALASDHFHPWTERQGQSPFVWSTLGGVAQATEDLRVGTGVTCPLVRVHPAIVAQAAATVATMLPGRFFLGVGTGENLNEHVLGDRWPPYDLRVEMLAEAVEVIRTLWGGEPVTYRGDHYTVEEAKLYSLPEEPPPIHVAAGGEQSARFAGRVGDGLVATAPEEALVEAFAAGGGDASDGGDSDAGDGDAGDGDGRDGDSEAGDGRDGDAGGEDAGDGDADDDRPRYGQVTVCWAETEAEARRTAHEWWPNAALPGQLGQALPTPAHFEQATSLVSEDDVAEAVVCGPDPERHVEAIREFADAGFDHVYVHQVGPDQDGFFDFYESEVLPAFE